MSIPTVEARFPARTVVRDARRVAGAPVARDRRGPARPVVLPVHPSGAARCTTPVTRRRTVSVPGGLVRRVAAGVGMVLASATAVVGLGLLADASAAAAGAASAVPVTAAP